MESSRQLLGKRSVAVRWAIALGTVAVALFVVIGVPALRDLFQSADEWIWETAIRLEWQPAVLVADALSLIGSGWVMVPFEIVVAVVLLTRRRWHALVFWVVSIGATNTIVWVSKAMYGRLRPPDSLVETIGASFPSGHSATAAVVAIGLVLLFAAIANDRKHWFYIAASWATLMAASRVYLRAHWLTDVVAGVTLAAAVSLAAAVLVDRWGDTGRGRESHQTEE